MTIKMKILIPMILLTVAMAASILVSNIWLFSNYVDETMSEGVNTASVVAEKELHSLENEASVASAYMADDASIIQAIASGNRDDLLVFATQMQNETGVEFCTITDKEGNVLVRSHEPEKFGDSVVSQANIASALSGKHLTAIEQGTAVRLSVRSGTPVYDSIGNLIGAVSVGYRLDTESFVDQVHSMLNCEITVLLGDERISTTVLKDDGTRAVGTKVLEDISSIVLSGQSYMGEAKILNRNALTKYTPILGVDGKPIGMLFVGRYLDEKTNTVWNFIKTDVMIILVLLALCVPIMLFVVKRIVMPIHMMVQASHALAAGDTEIEVRVNTKDEMGMLADAFNEIIDNSRVQMQTIESIASGDLTVSVETRSDKDHMNQALESMLQQNNDVFAHIVDSAVHVTSGARQIADSSQSLAHGAAEQSAAVDELSSIIGQVEVKTTENADMAQKAAQLADKIRDNAEKGSAQMERMVLSVNEINEASHSIGKIIKVIEDIAFQTNILALNASVEAAHAGQHGKGFAVVAEEVRSLAAKSTKAAKDTESIIEDAIGKAEVGALIAAETSASLKDIVSGIYESGQIVDEIFQSSEEQRTALSQINTGISQVAQVVQQNANTAQESAASSQQMNNQAELLQGLVSQFKLKESDDIGKQSLLSSPR